MTTLVKPHLERPVESHQDLVDYLARGARPRSSWGIGAEMEKLVVDADSGEAAPFDRIEALLLRLERLDGWQGIREEGRLIALVGERSSITLEPGGQLELSGALCPDIHCCNGDFSRHIAQIVAEGTPLGLRFLGLGVQPFTPLDQIDWLPKERYGVMGPYMARTGDLGQAMMKQTAGLQVNLDYDDENDCIAKLRLVLALAPLFYALFANSPLRGGVPSGFLSTRGEIWSRTDPDRTGLLPQLFADGAGFATYVDYALDVPMYFIMRGGRYLSCTGERLTFRRYLQQGWAGHRATLGDWDLHLSTLFPEARLRPQIEVRTPDSLPPHLTMAVAALVKGLLYDPGALSACREIFAYQNQESRNELYRQSWRLGLKTPMGSRTLREVAVEVLAIARVGLARQGVRDGRGFDETIYLDGIEEIAENGVTLAERLLSRWHGSRAEKMAVLMEHCGFGVPSSG
jgi:glutamate--cysteine ligase